VRPLCGRRAIRRDSYVETHPDGRTVGLLRCVRGGSAPRHLRLDFSSGSTAHPLREALVPVTPARSGFLSPMLSRARPRAKGKNVLPQRGAVRLRLASRAGTEARFKGGSGAMRGGPTKLPPDLAPSPLGAPRTATCLERWLPHVRKPVRSSFRAALDRSPVHCSLRAGRPSGASKRAKCGDFERLRYSSCRDTGKMVRRPIRHAVFSSGRASRSDGWA